MRGPFAQVAFVYPGRGGQFGDRHRSLRMQGLIQTKGVAHAHQGDARSAAKVRQHLSDELVNFCLVDHSSILPDSLSAGQKLPLITSLCRRGTSRYTCGHVWSSLDP